MKNLIIYDNTGFIYIQMLGDYRAPQGGVNFLEIEESLYTDKIIKSVDVSVAPHTIVTEEIPKTNLEIAEERLQAVEDSNAELMAIVASLTTPS